MSEAEKGSPKKLSPAAVLKGESPLVLIATLEPIVGDFVNLLMSFLPGALCLAHESNE